MDEANKREQLFALMVLDERTGAKVTKWDNNWVVMLTGPRFCQQYARTGLFVLEEMAIHAGVASYVDIPRVDLMRYYIQHASQWTTNVMLDDYRNDEQ